MSIETLASTLLRRPGFRARFNSVVADSMAGQFPALKRDGGLRSLEHNWNYLLQCASLLAQARTAECEDAALRIAQHCLAQASQSNLADAACVVFDMLTNKASIRLAEARQLVEPDPASRLPLPLRTEWVRREIEHLALVGNGRELALNRFQKAVWHATDEYQILSITAPTSTGKSFLLCQWLAEYFLKNPKALVVYLVPTRALIHQVENDLQHEFDKGKDYLPKINISSLPLSSSLKAESANMFVLTQERFHILMIDIHKKCLPSLMVIDEAHKFGDGARGILLNHVVDSTAAEAKAMKVIFASPLVSNPEILLRGRQGGGGVHAIASSHITVNQNLLWASQVPRKPTRWTLQACFEDEMISLGEFDLAFRPNPSSKRLPLVANALADSSGGNLIYINGAADAEKAAHQIWDLQQNTKLIDPEVQGLIDLVKRYIHPKYELVTTLSRGVAFHYGNMPLLIRTEIERLFKAGSIHFLVCTSTLIEGVNLPCKSIFVRGPQKGRGRPMDENDFWNLAGRAGRLGKEFQGNVICVDPNIKAVWRTPPPKRRSTYPIKPATDKVFDNFETLLEYIKDSSIISKKVNKSELDQLVSYLITRYVDSGGVLDAPGCYGLTDEQRIRLRDVIGDVVKSITLPIEILRRNPGVSHLGMERLLKYFQGRTKPVEELLPTLPESEDAAQTYNRIFCRINAHVDTVFVPTQRTFGLSILVVNWMRGFSLNRLIGSQISYYERLNISYKLANVIRDVMTDVEQIARFVAPRYISCYIDLLRHHLANIGREDLLDRLPDVNVWLEFGASQPTQLSMMGLGLSRTTAIVLSEYILDDSLSEAEVLTRIMSLSIESLGLPLAIEREIHDLMTTKGLV